MLAIIWMLRSACCIQCVVFDPQHAIGLSPLFYFQLIPLFMQDILGDLPGFPGLYLAGIFSGSLSTMSSGLNAVSMVVLEDFIRVYLKSRIRKEKERLILQIISVIFGFVCLEMTFLVSRFGSVSQAAMAVFGIFSGRLLGIFSLGLFFPSVNEKKFKKQLSTISKSQEHAISTLSKVTVPAILKLYMETVPEFSTVANPHSISLETEL
ncbi:hypothetical protein RRG08_030602 [Elysia crispata]|uniref:Uncharacterized protein n=1 Tax=Elysia crispata TaxID=231223 RepID=A0AAE1CS60_9GAST|nr:hypothetical protein RRG08_030602 [Elysia crispata]